LRSTKIILAAFVLILLVPILLLLLLSATPVIQLDHGLAYIGVATPIKIQVSDPHGTRRVSAYVEQNGQRQSLFETNQPSRRVLFLRREPPRDYTLAAGTKAAPQLKDGPARFVVEAVSNDFRGSRATEARDVTVVTQPPRVLPDSAQHYISQGGSELVTFAISGVATASGVKAGRYTFRSFPVPGKQTRFSLFAFPWDLSADSAAVVYASGPAGDQVTARFWQKVFPKAFRRRDLDISDDFLNKVVPAIDPSGSGDMLARFLKINGEMRRRNNQTLADLRLKTEERILWSGPFLQLADSKVESRFADVRSYMYHGKKVDEQVHLGFDLSKVKNTPIAAANDGKVIFAERLGIYGNCVVIDHGYGLQSIYGHLNQIQAKPGDMVKKGQVIGLSGDTGLAGGDHVHFSMQVDGVQVNPLEWWDAHWIHDRILSRIEPAK
jgi:murein DD-endopeptidase MepM/ murein hydrolase activator NlpD